MLKSRRMSKIEKDENNELYQLLLEINIDYFTFIGMYMCLTYMCLYVT